MKVLLIGGAGFIGQNIAARLSTKPNTEITIADNLFRGKLDTVLQGLVDSGVKLVVSDFTERASFDQLEVDYDQVYMLASVVGVKYTEEIPHELIRINTSLIMNTLDWLSRSQCKKILFTSTSENYAGTIESFGYQIPTPEDVPLCIQDIAHPRFTYAVTKMLGESAFLNYARVYPFEATIVRYHNVYGPRMGFKHVIPQVVQRFIDGENPFEIMGHDQTRSFNYIDDAVNGTMLAMDSAAANGEIFHIGDSQAEITIDTLVRYIGELCGYEGEYKLGENHSGSVSRRCPDTQKAKKLLGYEPQTDWKVGVKATVEWYTDYLKNAGDVFE